MGKRNTNRAVADLPAANAWYRSAPVLVLIGGLILFAAFPPLGLAPLVWLAPVPFVLPIKLSQLQGRRCWLGIWGASAVHWLLMIQGIRLAHWANYFGWFALAGYLAVYLPAFLWLTRVAVQQVRIPLWISAPVIWTGLELVRGHLITGFSMGLLGHALVEWTTMIQIADLFGAYGVSFLIVLVAACVVECLPWGRREWRWSPALVALAALACTGAYGYYRLRPPSPPPVNEAPLKVALLQGSFDKVFEYDPQRNIDTFQHYLALAEQARDAIPHSGRDHLAGIGVYRHNPRPPRPPCRRSSAAGAPTGSGIPCANSARGDAFRGKGGLRGRHGSINCSAAARRSESCTFTSSSGPKRWPSTTGACGSTTRPS